MKLYNTRLVGFIRTGTRGHILYYENSVLFFTWTTSKIVELRAGHSMEAAEDNLRKFIEEGKNGKL